MSSNAVHLVGPGIHVLAYSHRVQQYGKSSVVFFDIVQKDNLLWNCIFFVWAQKSLSRACPSEVVGIMSSSLVRLLAFPPHQFHLDCILSWHFRALTLVSIFMWLYRVAIQLFSSRSIFLFAAQNCWPCCLGALQDGCQPVSYNCKWCME